MGARLITKMPGILKAVLHMPDNGTAKNAKVSIRSIKVWKHETKFSYNSDDQIGSGIWVGPWRW